LDALGLPLGRGIVGRKEIHRHIEIRRRVEEEKGESEDEKQS
jgi:hypothetical protein